MIQATLFNNTQPVPALRIYRPFLTASENGKGVMDVDTVKGCTLGMAAYPDGGCYGECYAQKTAVRYGINFSVSGQVDQGEKKVPKFPGKGGASTPGLAELF